MRMLKQALADGEGTFGSWLCLGHSTVAEIMADAGFDWLVIDLEHTPIGIGAAAELIRVIELKGLTPLVRLTSNDPNQIKRVMDAGAHGVVVPMVTSAAEAEAAVRAVHYPPRGTRGFGLARAQRFGPGFEEYLQQLPNTAVVIVQIEHVAAIDNLEAILSVEGVDGSMIGPYDLSGSIGIPGQFDDPRMRELLARYEEVSRSLNLPMGYHVVQPDHAALLRREEAGYTFLALGTDFLFLGESCRAEMSALRVARNRICG